MELPVADLESAIPFYEQMMGFKVTWKGNSPGPSATLERESVRIGLCENGGDPSQEGCFFEVDRLETAMTELRSYGLENIGKSDTQVYGDTTWKVFFVIAPDGLCYCLGEKQP
jgi:lactoylglutathione lyase